MTVCSFAIGILVDLGFEGRPRSLFSGKGRGNTFSEPKVLIIRGDLRRTSSLPGESDADVDTPLMPSAESADVPELSILGIA